MPVETGLYQILRNDAGVSSWVNGRVFGSRLPKDPTLPSVVFNVVYTTDVYSTQGASGFRIKRVQIDSYARKYMDSIKCSDAVRAVLQSFSGAFPDGSSINGIIVMRDMDFPFEPGPSGYVFRHLLEVDIQYTETALPFVAPGTIYPVDDDTEFDDEGQP